MVGLICKPKIFSKIFLILSVETDTPAKVLKIVATSERCVEVLLLFVYFFLFALGVCSLLVLWVFEGFLKYTADTSSTTMCIRQASRAEMKAELN